jgi:uncharacterized membrane protein YqaE (UPF0057 family)
MRYFLAIVFPPLAVLLCGKPIQAILNVFLCVGLWIPGVVHALFVVNDYKSVQRTKELAFAMGASRR